MLESDLGNEIIISHDIQSEILSHLKEFYFTSKLQEAVFMYMINGFVGEDDL